MRGGFESNGRDGTNSRNLIVNFETGAKDFRRGVLSIFDPSRFFQIAFRPSLKVEDDLLHLMATGGRIHARASVK